MRRTPIDDWLARRLGVDTDALRQETVEEYQLEAFRRTLAFARENSPFYGALLRGVRPEELRTLEDLKSVPTSSEEDLAGHENDFLCCRQGEVERVVTVPTTGTSGKRKRLSFTAGDLQRAEEFIYYAYLMLCQRGDRMLVYMSGGTPGSIGDVVRRAMDALDMEVEVYGAVTDIEAAYRKLLDFRPQVVTAIPHQAAALARFGERYGNPEREWIRSALLSADDVPESVCRRLERLWGCGTFRHYGMTEMCIAGGCTCAARRGYHLRGADILYEIPEQDENGEGEIVITTLDREAMPLIRYRTGDLGRFIDTPCPCGSPLRRLEYVRGRRRNVIRRPEGDLPLSAVEEAVFSLPEAVDLECAVTGEGRVLLTVFTLPGDTLSRQRVLTALEPLDLRPEVTVLPAESFRPEKGLKKKVTYS